MKAKHEEYHSRLGKYAHFDSENIFEGLVVCACCQHNMTRYKSVYNKGRAVAYHFICPRHAMLLDAGCPNAGGLRENDLKEAVYEVLRLQMAMLTDAESVIQKVSRSSAARSRRTALDNEIVSVQGRLKKLDSLRQTLFESYVDGIVTQADYLFGKSRYEDETRQLERRLQDLQAEKDALPEASPKQNKWFSAFAKFRDEKELSRKMLLALVEKIYVNEDKQVQKARFAEYDPEQLVRQIIRLKDKEAKSRLSSCKQDLKTYTAWLSELERLMQNLYEDKCAGTIPQTVFQTLMRQYEAERAEKAETIPELERRVKAHQENQTGADRWLEVIRRYTEITELDETILFELVDRIEVGDTRKVHGLRVCDIKVYYRYVGNVDDALAQERRRQFEKAI